MMGGGEKTNIILVSKVSAAVMAYVLKCTLVIN